MCLYLPMQKKSVRYTKQQIETMSQSISESPNNIEESKQLHNADMISSLDLVSLTKPLKVKHRNAITLLKVCTSKS